MAIYYIDPSASTNGSGTFASPYNVPPTLVTGNEYWFKEGTVWSGRTATWAINLANIVLGVYDATTGNRVTDGSKWATFDWRNSIVGSSAISLGANCGTGFDCQGIIIKAGWFVNHGGVTYQSMVIHTSTANDEPGVGVNWSTNWAAHKTYITDSPAWALGVSYSRNNGSCLSTNIPSTSMKLKHIRTFGCATGITMVSTGIIAPEIEDVICSMPWGTNGVPINGISGGLMSNPSIKELYCLDAPKGMGITLQYISGTGPGIVIDGIGAKDCGAGGIIFRFVSGVHSIKNINATDNIGSNVNVDSGCSGLKMYGVIGDRATDNGFSGNDLFLPGNPPVNCEVYNFRFLDCGNVARYSVVPAVDGDGFSCHAGTGWVFDTGFSCRNLNSGCAHVGGAAGTIRNTVITHNGKMPDYTPAPAEYNRGGVALVDSGGWVLENCIVDQNLPYDFKLSSPALLTADTNLIGDGTSTTNLSNSLARAAFIAAVIAGGGTCTNVVTGDSLLDPDDDFAPITGSAAIGTGKGVGIGNAGVDCNGNQRPAPSGLYNIGHREDYPPAKAGFGPWVHFDGTLQPLTTAAKFNLTRTVKSEGKPLTDRQINNYVEDTASTIWIDINSIWSK